MVSLILDDAPGFHNLIRGNVAYNNIALYTGVSKAGFTYHTDGNGIILDLHGTDAPLTLIENNIVYNNGGRGINVYKSSNAVVRNNTSYKNCLDPDIDDGELTVFSSRNVVFVNNIAFGSGVRTTGASNNLAGSITFAYNVYGGGAVAQLGTGGVQVTDAATLFRNAATFDFRPCSGALSVDTGTIGTVRVNPTGSVAVTASGYAPTDFVGRRRVVGKGADKGAYEFIATGR